MNRPENISKINTELRNRIGGIATAMFREGNRPTGIRVEARKYHDRGTLTYVWEASYVTGNLECYVYSRTLNKDFTMGVPREVAIDAPVRPSTRANIHHIVETPQARKQVFWNRIAGLLVSCAWQVWDKSDTTVVLSLIKDDQVFPVLEYDGVEVYEI